MEHRYRCSACKWDGLESDIREHKKLSGKSFPVCPGCGKHKERRTEPLPHNRSVLTGYAVCGNVYEPFGWKCCKRVHSGDHQDNDGNVWLGSRHLAVKQN